MAKKVKDPDEKPKKQKTPKAKPEGEGGEKSIPLLLESALALSRLAVILVGFGSVFLAIKAGSDLLNIALRGGIAVLVAGLYTWIVNWMLTHQSLEGVHRQVERVSSDVEEAGSINREG